jgi:hypothetical protein
VLLVLQLLQWPLCLRLGLLLALQLLEHVLEPLVLLFLLLLLAAGCLQLSLQLFCCFAGSHLGQAAIQGGDVMELGPAGSKGWIG